MRGGEVDRTAGAGTPGPGFLRIRPQDPVDGDVRADDADDASAEPTRVARIGLAAGTRLERVIDAAERAADCRTPDTAAAHVTAARRVAWRARARIGRALGVAGPVGIDEAGAGDVQVVDRERCGTLTVGVLLDQRAGIE